MLTRFLVVAGSALASMATAATPPIDCAALQAIAASAEREFAPVRGKLQRTETAADLARERKLPTSVLSNLDYAASTYATTRPLQGAATCEIRIGRLNDEAAATKQAAYRCTWPAEAVFGALKQSARACLTDARDVDDSDPDALYVLLEQVSSGEGERSLVVSVEREATRGVTVAVERTVCLDREQGGCEDE